MPGIHRNRIVGKDEGELDEMTCGICRGIFEEPIVTHCCRQTYCTLCINEWLVDNNTCPNDRQTLGISGLSPSPRLVINLLNKMKVKCANNGCEVITTIEEMKDHEHNCDKNCSSCRNLKETINKNQDEIKTLQSKLKKVERDLKVVNKKFEDFKLTSQPKKRSVVILDVRTSVDNYDIETTNLDKRELQSLIANCQNAINCTSDLGDLAKRIRDKMNAKYGFDWTIIADTDFNVGVSGTAHKFARINFCNLMLIRAHQHIY